MFCTVLGIVLTFIGTTLSLWSILNLNKKVAGSWLGLKNYAEEAPKQKRLAKMGIVIIAIGSIFQIVGIFYL